jgi:uncharacterized protein
MKNEFWVLLPVKDLQKSKQFYMELGFSLNDRQGNPENMVGLLVGKKDIALNLFKEKEFKRFSANETSDAKTSTEVLFNLDAKNNDEVDEFAEKVKKAGGKIFRETGLTDGWMYSCGFADLDGHRWAKVYMDFSKMPKQS